MMGVRGIRGAITVVEDTSEQVLSATKEVVDEMVRQNEINPEDIGAVFITVTHDILSDFPAKAVRTLPGWQYVPLMCSNEIPVAGGLEKCIRIMMMVNTDRKQQEINHVFLRDAIKLRPDLVEGSR